MKRLSRNWGLLVCGEIGRWVGRKGNISRDNARMTRGAETPSPRPAFHPLTSLVVWVKCIPMKINDFHKTVLLYGGALASLTFLLQFFEYRFFIRDLSLEAYLGVVAALCAGLGVWVGKKLTR